MATSEEMIDFLKYAYLIKETDRRGWTLSGIAGGETVACHMYRMAVMALLLDGDESVDANKCIRLALVHDLAEAIVGDITPDCGVSAEDKHAREAAAMEVIAGCLGDSRTGQVIRDLWHEYEEDASEEAHRAHELDKLEFALQTMEYEEKHSMRLDDFFKSASSRIKHPKLVDFFNAILRRRSQGPSL